MDKYDEMAEDVYNRTCIVDSSSGQVEIITAALRESAAQAYEDAANILTANGVYEENNVQVRRFRDKAAVLRSAAPEKS